MSGVEQGVKRALAAPILCRVSDLSGAAADHLPLTLRYRLTVDDMAASMSVVSGSSLLWVAIIGDAFVVVIVSFVWLLDRDTTTIVFGVFWAALVFLLLRTAWFRRRLVRSSIRRRSAEALAYSEVTLNVTAEGLHVQQSATTSLLGWPDVTGTRENDQVFVVFNGKVPRMTIPKHAFHNAAALADFRTAIAKHSGRMAVS